MRREDRKAIHRGIAYEVFGVGRPDCGVSIDDAQQDPALLKTLKSCPFCKSKAGLRIVNTHTLWPWIECDCGMQLHPLDRQHTRLPNPRSVRQTKLVMNVQIDRVIDGFNRRERLRV